MKNKNIYSDIATRTNGDIYIGVVGPVRVGKSTFITRFMEEFVIPKMISSNTKVCTIDELPQSADGATIMTTQPKFIPAESVPIQVASNVNINVKMIDCVGYFVQGAQGHKEDDKPRMVKTPWTKDSMPFEEAAEFGTRKVVKEHSTIAILMTTDGSFGEIPRDNFIPVENRLVKELKECGKPFVIVVNSKEPKSDKTTMLVEDLYKKHNIGVVALDATQMGEVEVSEVFEKMLNEFPLTGIELNMPDWITALSFDNAIIQEVMNELKRVSNGISKIGQFEKGEVLFANSERFEPIVLTNIELSNGKIIFDLIPKDNLFYEVLSLQCGILIKDDFELVSYMKELSQAKQEYDKLKDALQQVRETGYGVVAPTINDMSLDEPELVKQSGGRWGVKIKASAPSLHIMRVDLETEISPMVGTEQQSKDLVTYLSDQNKDNPNGIWETNMFGKSVHQLMNEGLNSKINAMPIEAQKKMRKTLTRIVNEGKGGIICILL